MGLGVLEDHRMRHVPGTVILDDEQSQIQQVTVLLKHGSGKDSHIVLNPQPSDDPNDPLNWAAWRKEACLATLCIGAVLNVAVNGSLLNPAAVEISRITKHPVQDIIHISGYNLLATAASAPFFCAMSRKYGKRPPFLLSVLLAIIGTAIGQASATYERLLACRIIQGFSASTFEGLMFAVVGDLYCVHQRGSRLSICNLAIIVSASLANIISGQVYRGLGLKWIFHIYQIFLVILFISMVFLCPEMAYNRDAARETDEVAVEHLEELANYRREQLEKAVTDSEQVENTPSGPIGSTLANASSRHPKKTFFQEISIYNGTFTSDPLWKLVLAPFLTLLNPAGLYAIIASAMFSCLGITFLMLTAVLFAKKPWQFNPSQIGMLSFGPLAGGIIGFFLAAAINDPTSKFMARRNNGIYEPEFRLVHLPWPATFLTIGLFLYGHYIEIGANAILCTFWFGFQKVGLLVGTVSVLSYALDAFRSSSSEIFIMSMILKNFVFYAFASFSTQWFTEDGPFQAGAVLGGVNLGICLLGIPVYIFGKRLRSWWCYHDVLALLKLSSSIPGAPGAH